MFRVTHYASVKFNSQTVWVVAANKEEVVKKLGLRPDPDDRGDGSLFIGRNKEVVGVYDESSYDGSVKNNPAGVRRKHLPLKKTRLAGRIYTVALFGSDADLKRIAKRLRKNPTPLLRNLRGDATFLIQQLGREKAIQVARTMTGDSRRNALLIRMIERSGVHKLRKRPVRKTMLDKLIEDHGTTSPMSARGFILTDGECLNLGQYDDHRIICGVYPDSHKAELRYGSRYGAFKHLCEKFNMIRWIPEAKQCEVFVEPTRQQVAAMRELAENGMLKEIEVHPPRKASCIIEAEDADTLVAGVEALYS